MRAQHLHLLCTQRLSGLLMQTAAERGDKLLHLSLRRRVHCDGGTDAMLPRRPLQLAVLATTQRVA
jgi:hypothetical protein